MSLPLPAARYQVFTTSCPHNSHCIKQVVPYIITVKAFILCCNVWYVTNICIKLKLNGAICLDMSVIGYGRTDVMVTGWLN